MDDYPENWKLLIVVGGNAMVNTLVDMFRRLFRNSVSEKTYTASTREDAQVLIENYRQSQPLD
ncbi:MAG: hypothetical protein AAFV98_24495 [Chloroflexota bacterium]